MEAILNSFFLVFISEMGDKTQLLALILAVQFRKPIPILCGILVATLLNHALASFLGVYVTQLVTPENLKWILALTFIGFGVWMLFPDQFESSEQEYKWGPFLTTTLAFFIAEMGDKTQLATLALGAKYTAPIAVTVGTTLGMLAANTPAVFFGHGFTQVVPMVWVHRISSALFIIFGVGILLGI